MFALLGCAQLHTSMCVPHQHTSQRNVELACESVLAEGQSEGPPICVTPVGQRSTSSKQEGTRNPTGELRPSFSKKWKPSA